MKKVMLNLLWLPVCLLVVTSCQKESEPSPGALPDSELESPPILALEGEGTGSGDGGSNGEIDPSQLLVSDGVLVFRTVEYYEAIVDAAVHPEDYVPEAGEPAPIEQDGWEDQAIVDFVDASDHISYGSIYGAESEFDDPFIDAILNQDRIVQIGNWLIKLDMTRGKVFVISSELPNAYQDLLDENPASVQVFSMEEDVLAILRGEDDAASRGCGGVGGISDDETTFKPHLGAIQYTFKVQAKYRKYGIYFKLFAQVKHEHRGVNLVMYLSVENTEAWARIRPCRKRRTIWASAGFKNLVPIFDPDYGITHRWSFYSGSRGLNGYNFFVKARVNLILPGGIPIGRPEDSRTIGRRVNYNP